MSQQTEIILNSDLPLNSKILGALGSMMGRDKDDIIKDMISVINHDESERLEKQFPLPRPAKKYTPTQKALVSMLTENTGAHMLDSGGAYGRHWQTNRMIKDFRDFDRVGISTNNWNNTKSFSISLNLFQFLENALELDQAMDTKFKRFANRKANKNESWPSVIMAFVEDELGLKCDSGNSYNYENCLSQDFQYHVFELDGIEYVIIQTHNGCDIRGGYSMPRVFKHESFNFLDFGHVWARCDCEGNETDTYDGGYTWDNWPSEWHVSTRKNAVYCQDCKKEVRFN